MEKHTFTKKPMDLTGDAIIAVIFTNKQDGSVHTEIKAEASIVHLGIAAEMAKNHFEQQVSKMPMQEATNIRVAVVKAVYPDNFAQTPQAYPDTALPCPAPMPTVVTPNEGGAQR